MPLRRSTLGLLLAALTITLATSAIAADYPQWHWLNPTPTGNCLHAMTASGGRVELAWFIETDEDVAGFRVVREDLTAGSTVSLPPGGLLSPRARRYTDDDITPGHEYQYTLIIVFADGSELTSTTLNVTIAPIRAGLDQNYPNPFNPTTRIPYAIGETAMVTLELFDAAGHRVRTLVNEVKQVGKQVAEWDGRDDAGNAVASGVYFYRLRVGTLTASRRMVLVR